MPPCANLSIMTEKTNPLIDKLFSVGAHYGYAKSRRHPSVRRFIFGSKGNVEIFDLEQTSAMMEKALAFLTTAAAKRETVLFVGSKPEARGALERVARRLNQPFVVGRWIGGSLTNWSEIKKRLARLQELTDMREKGEGTKFTKLERLLLEREEKELDAMFGGLRGLEKTPSVMVVVDSRKEATAIAEAAKLGIPVVALINSDCDASVVNYAIPANDSSRHTIELVLGEIAQAMERGAAMPAPTPAVAAPVSAE